ncbi:MAG: hypothetical protein KA974_00465 [Saprospiraceae bacterium]|nr:hypothetical protein [Saprospiraceae bacterium]MBP7679926.1 hypothetical protein [Saprospiraceae bacterium]
MQTFQKKWWLIVALAGLATTLLNAQIEKTLHQSFPADSVQQIHIELTTDYEIVPWVSNAILTETKILLENASNDIMKYLERMGRYQIDSKYEGTQLTLKPKDISKVGSKKDTPFAEKITIKIYVPDTFDSTNKSNLIRKDTE